MAGFNCALQVTKRCHSEARFNVCDIVMIRDGVWDRPPIKDGADRWIVNVVVVGTVVVLTFWNGDHTIQIDTAKETFAYKRVPNHEVWVQKLA
eukprot:TRINITY_DN44382_c0_g1_i1.p2 TRINITY_DN44382_c0_g1~~TRINITY_DN44382_c0_g1_i1.p2  ORF type:complete len:103 (-),score=17.69 TRINITY_DN44382_c0_g1_i1:49-327(-)